MKRKPLISIEEQLYRDGIWERPGYKIKEYPLELPQSPHIFPAEVKIEPVDESMIAFMDHPFPHMHERNGKIYVEWFDSKTGKKKRREYNNGKWGNARFI